MFRKAKDEVKSQIVAKVADNVSTQIVDTGKAKLQELANSYQQSTQSTQSTTLPAQHITSSVQNVTKHVETSSIKEAIENEVTVKVNTCVASMIVTFLVGFFTQLEYVKPVHPVLSIPVFSILAFSACFYSMRYLTRDIKVRSIITVCSGLFVGALARHLSIKLGQYQFITEDQPLLLFPLLGVCALSFVGLFRYIFEISKKYEERWQMFKND